MDLIYLLPALMFLALAYLILSLMDTLLTKTIFSTSNPLIYLKSIFFEV